MRGGLRLLLEAEPGLEVVGEAADGVQTVQLAREVTHDVILMDLLMPRIDGVEATRRILARSPKTRVLVLTSYGSDEKLFPALDAGALGFLLKDSTGEELIWAIRQVARGLSALSPPIARRVVRYASHHSLDRHPELLTERELEILRVLAHGHSNDEIGDVLHISPATVRTHLTQVFAKLGLTRRSHAMLYALKHGIADLDEEIQQPVRS